MSPKSWAQKLFARTPRTVRRPAPARVRLGAEALGDRLLPSATTELFGDTLRVTADDAGSDVSVDFVRTMVFQKVVVSETRRNAFGGTTRVPLFETNSPVAHVQFLGGAGNDRFGTNAGSWVNGPAVWVYGWGGGGNDTLSGGTGPDRLDGGPGNDSLSGGWGDDTLAGHDGDDTLVGGNGDDTYRYDTDTPLGSDSVDAGAEYGTDVHDFSASDRAVSFTLNGDAAQAVNGNLTLRVYGATGPTDVIGGSGDDTLTGNASANRLTGGPGNDWLTGGSGDDRYVLATAPVPAAGVETDYLMAEAGGVDELDFAASTAGVSVDLSRTDVQTVSPGRAVKLHASLADGRPGYENVHGTRYNDTLTGNSSRNTFVGWDGDDTFAGSGGQDTYWGGAGADVLDRRGNNGYLRDGGADDTTYDSVGGEAPGRLSAGELKATGQLNAFRVGDRLWLTGPSGAGFALKSGWGPTAVRADGKLVFHTTKELAFETSWGHVTLPGGGPKFEVVCTPTRAGGVGADPEFFYAGVPLTSQAARNFTAVTRFFADLAGRVTAKMESVSGGDMTLPGVSWGVELGADVGDAKAPLNPAVPYLFVTGQTGVAVQFEGGGFDNSKGATVAYAPGDGTIYAGVTGLPVVSDLGIGVSTDGYLPYRPEQIPDGSADPDIYGHFYLRGQVDVESFALKGGLVLDLDANDDGTLAGGSLSEGRLGDLADAVKDNLGDLRKLMDGSAADAFNDVSFGMNTGASVGIGGFSLDLGSSSFWRTPRELAFRGQLGGDYGARGIAGVGGLTTTAKVTTQGFVRLDGTWGVGWSAELGLNAGTASVGGVRATALKVTAGSHVNGGVGARVEATVAFDFSYYGYGLGASANVTGYAGRDGRFSLHGDTSVWVNIPNVYSGSIRLEVTVDNGGLDLDITRA